MLLYHLIIIGILALFAAAWSAIFCYFVGQSAKSFNDAYGVAALGAFVFAAGCVAAMTVYWTNFLYPLLH